MLLTAIIIALCTASVFIWLFRKAIVVYYTPERIDRRAKLSVARKSGLSYAYINESIEIHKLFKNGVISEDEWFEMLTRIKERYPMDAKKVEGTIEELP